MEKVKQIKIGKGISVNNLVKEMGKSGVLGAGRIARAAEIIEKMFKDKECKVFLGLAGAMVPGGMKDVIIDMLDHVDVFVTTGANLTHDLVEALGYGHYKGTSNISDVELHKKQINRMYDSFMPNKVYEGLEKFFNLHFNDLAKQKNIKEFLWVLGSKVKKDSILRKCFEKKIPVFCPAISDSAIGLMMWNNIVQGKDNNINTFDDLKEILDIAWTSKRSGVIYIGGGVPKNYIQQAMQFSKSAKYGVQITTEKPEFGGSSGAELREGISWGKMSEKGVFVDVLCDATIALPLIYSAVKERL